MEKVKNILLIFSIFYLGNSFGQNVEMLNKLSKKIIFKNSRSLELKNSSLIALDSVADFMKCSIFEYYIESHSSSRGAKEFNLKNTKKRSELIKFELIKRGVVSNRLFPIGLGETDPEASYPTRVGQSQNERIIIKKKFKL